MLFKKNSFNQLKEIDIYIQSVKNEPYKAHLLRYYPLTEYSRIKSIEIEKVKKFFQINKISNEDFANFYRQIDYLFDSYTNIMSGYHKNNDIRITPASNEFFQIKDEILQSILKYVENLGRTGHSESEMFKYLHSILNLYYEPSNADKVILASDIKYDFDNLIYKLLWDMVTKYRDEEIYFLMQTKLEAAKKKYISILGANTTFINSVIVERDEIIKTSKEFNVIVKKLRYGN